MAGRSCATLGIVVAVTVRLGACGAQSDPPSAAVDRAFDALSIREIKQAVAGARAQPLVTASARIVSVWLEEPTKDSVMAGLLPRRRAHGVTYDAAHDQTVELIVDVNTASALSATQLSGVQPMMGMTDSRLADTRELVRQIQEKVLSRLRHVSRATDS